jgi:hypothetical protein
MKKLLLLLALCIPLFALAQVERMPSLTASYNAAQSGGDGTTWTLTGNFSDASGIYDASGVQVGDIVFFSDGSYTFFLPITEIVDAMHPTLSVKVSKVGITQISSVGSGMKAIFHPTSKGYFPFVSGISNADQQVYNEYLMSLLDQGGSSCELTITQTAHGFSPFTPLVFNGSAYERPTNDTIIPDYVIVDSLTANTFKVASCGTYPTVLANGVYWYTSASPGYSLTQNTIKVPLFSVVGGKLTLRPLIGFNLGSTGGTADGNGIYAGSDSLSQENTYAAMAADGSQTFGLGYFPDFPDENYEYSTYGLFVNPLSYGEVSLLNKASTLRLFDGQVNIETQLPEGHFGRISNQGYRIRLLSTGISGQYSDLQIDSVGLKIQTGSTNYRLIPNPNTNIPSTTPNTVNILKWTAGVPSFGRRYETDTIAGNVYLKMDAAETYDFAIGRFANFPNGFGSGTGRTYGFYASPKDSRWGVVGSYNVSSGTIGGLHEMYQGLSGSSFIGYYDFVSARTRYNRVIADSSGVKLFAGDFSSTETKQLSLNRSGIRYHYDPDISLFYSVLPNTPPSTTASAISTLQWTAGTPSFLRSQHRVATGTTDGSGDLTVTFAAAMPDATYTMIATVEGTTSYTISVHTKATGTCKVRFFNPTTGAAVTATSVTISYEVKDSN